MSSRDARRTIGSVGNSLVATWLVGLLCTVGPVEAVAQAAAPSEQPGSQLALQPTAPMVAFAPAGAPPSGSGRDLALGSIARSPYRVWAWVTAGLAVAFGATSLTTALLARDRAAEMEGYVRDNSCGEGCNGRPSSFFDDTALDIEREGKAFSAVANIFLGLTIIAASTSGILWGLDHGFRQQRVTEQKQQHARKARGVTVVPWTSANGGGVLGRLTF